MGGGYELYVDTLRNLAKTGADALEVEARLRFLKQHGPFLREDESSLVDLFCFAYSTAEADEQAVFIETFLRLLAPFRQAWFAGGSVSDAEAGLLHYALLFFASIEADHAFRHHLKKLVDSVVGSRSLFYEVVRLPDVDGLYGQVEQFYLRYLDHRDSTYPVLLSRLWESSIGEKEAALSRMARLLEALAASAPDGLTVRHLFIFFQKTAGLEMEERAEWLHSLFLTVGRLLQSDSNKGLNRREVEQFLSGFSGDSKTFDQAEIPLFLEFLFLVWPADNRAGFVKIRRQLTVDVNKTNAPRKPKSDNLVQLNRSGNSCNSSPFTASRAA